MNTYTIALVATAEGISAMVVGSDEAYTNTVGAFTTPAEAWQYLDKHPELIDPDDLG